MNTKEFVYKSIELDEKTRREFITTNINNFPQSEIEEEFIILLRKTGMWPSTLTTAYEILREMPSKEIFEQIVNMHNAGYTQVPNSKKIKDLVSKIIERIRERHPSLNGSNGLNDRGKSRNINSVNNTQQNTANRLREIEQVADKKTQGKLLSTLQEEIFPKWQPYPKLYKNILTKDQLLFIEFILSNREEDNDRFSLEYQGLFNNTIMLSRMLEDTTSGCDIPITIENETLPLWAAVSHVSSGHKELANLLIAFQEIPHEQALNAWKEMASGHAYDLWDAHAISFKEAGVPKTSSKVKHWTLFINWMTEANLMLGLDGYKAAVAIANEALTLIQENKYCSHMMVYLSISSLIAHSPNLEQKWLPLSEKMDLSSSIGFIHKRIYVDPLMKKMQKTIKWQIK